MEVSFLMVRRRDTLGFVEFMRGKYSLENIDYIKQLLQIMTRKERELITTHTFDELWSKLWMEKIANTTSVNTIYLKKI